MYVHHLLVDPVSSYALTSGRLWSLVAAALGVAGLVAGGLALARARRKSAVVALVAGLSCTVVGVYVVSAAEGGPGTGYGIVGGVIDLVLGPIALLLGGLALARSRREA